MSNRIGFWVGLSALYVVRGAVCPLKDETTVAYYAGHGATSDCQDWEENFFTWWAKAEPKVVYHRMTALNTEKDCDLSTYPNLKLWVQPGGDAYDQQTSMKAGGKENILKFIQRKNSSYLGTCAGYYLAATDYWWQGEHDAWPNMLGIFPTLEGSITSIWDYDKPPGYTLTEAASTSGDHNLTTLYWGGPTVGLQHTNKSLPSDVSVHYTFGSIPGALPAIVSFKNVLLSSVHLEAYEGHPTIDLKPEERLANYIMRAKLINSVTGLSWKIPTST